jgi:hypothetical protein
MVSTRRGALVSVVIAVFTIAALGCASSGVPKYIGPNELPSLAGTWVGWVTLPSGRAFEATCNLSGNGDYVVRGGGFSATGKGVVKDGNLYLTSTSMTGGIATGERTSTASLSQREDGSMVLNGFGHADAGPFNFLLVRQK